MQPVPAAQTMLAEIVRSPSPIVKICNRRWIRFQCPLAARKDSGVPERTAETDPSWPTPGPILSLAAKIRNQQIRWRDRSLVSQEASCDSPSHHRGELWGSQFSNFTLGAVDSVEEAQSSSSSFKPRLAALPSGCRTTDTSRSLEAMRTPKTRSRSPAP